MPQNIHPADVVALVRKTETTVAQVAISAGLHPSGLSQALRRPIPAANQAIADHLGMTLNDLWPEWYLPDGSPIPRRKTSTGNSSSQRKKSRAA